MPTVYSQSLFIKSILSTSDGRNTVECTLKEQQGRFNVEDLVRNDSKGNLVGRLTNPTVTPNWLVPGTVLYGKVNNIPITATVEPVIQSRIKGLQKILGDKIMLSYVVVTEFN